MADKMGMFSPHHDASWCPKGCSAFRAASAVFARR